MLSNKALIYTQVPEGTPVPGQHLKIEERSFDSDATPPSRGFTAEVLHVSFDPYLRHRMNYPGVNKDFPPFDVGATVTNEAIVKILCAGSECKFQAGDVLIGTTPIQEFVTAEDTNQFKLLENPLCLDPRLFIGILGGAGLTAYSAFYELGQPKKGQTILVSAAAGAVGQIVGQLAKREGLTVIGSVGSDEKLRILTEELGFDDGLNYRKGNLQEELARLAPGGIDTYFDNVGGPLLEAAIGALKFDGRIIACGYASQYNLPADEQYGIRNTGLVVGKRLTWRGFITGIPGLSFSFNYVEEHQKNLQQWIKDGTFKPVMSTTAGIDKAAEGLAALFRGENVGKAILDVKV